MPLDLPRVAQSLDFTCGAACFDSMFRYFFKSSPGELHFARELGALDLGFTPPEAIVELARRYGLASEMIKGARIEHLSEAFGSSSVIFVTWWDEDAGHYSLVKEISDGFITLMDPWAARADLDTRLPIELFIENWRARGALFITAEPQTEKS